MKIRHNGVTILQGVLWGPQPQQPRWGRGGLACSADKVKTYCRSLEIIKPRSLKKQNISMCFSDYWNL